MYPEKLNTLFDENITAIWLAAKNESVLKNRMMQNQNFYKEASNSNTMIKNYIARSLWYNTEIKRQAAECDMPVIEIDEEMSKDDILEAAYKGMQ